MQGFATLRPGPQATAAVQACAVLNQLKLGEGKDRILLTTKQRDDKESFHRYPKLNLDSSG